MMKVSIAQHRINDMNNVAEKLTECLRKMSYEENRDKIKALEEDYGITPALLNEAKQFLSITAKNFQEDLDNCNVDCQCW